MIRQIESKSILNKTRRRDQWFLDDYTLNPYSACSFNCIYCYIRGSKYGINMEEKLFVKMNAVELLDKELTRRAKKNQYGIIVLSSATDPYLHAEENTMMTGQLLEVILKHRFPLHVITKSELVLRDLNVLKSIGKEAILPFDLKDKLNTGVFITFSFSTLDDQVAGIFEPGATIPSIRLKTMESVLENGFKSGVSLMPLIPFISDTSESLENMFTIFKKAGINYIFPASITLFGDRPADSRTLVFRAIARHYPQFMDNYTKLFSSDSSILREYQSGLTNRTNALLKKYSINSRILT